MSPVLFTIIYLLCVVMCLAIGTMLAWQLWSVAIGETAVESYDHEYYRKVASSRGEVSLQTQLPPISSYTSRRPSKTLTTLGSPFSLLPSPSSLLSHFYRKLKNLELFLNIGIDG